MRRPVTSLALMASLIVAACAGDDGEEPTSAPTAAVTTSAPSPPTTAGPTGPGDELFTPESTVTDAATSPAATIATVATTTAPATTSTTTTTTTDSTASTTSTSAPTSTTVASTPFVSPCPPTGSQVWENRPASDLPAPPLPDGWRTDSIGTSVQGRDLGALVRPVDSAARTVVVIGGIHGNEPASAPSVRAMVGASVPDDTEVWLVPLLNPDGSAVGTRCNANGVDLNRNFSWDWRPSTGGPSPFSEPEPQAARGLIERLQPDLVVWVHQPLDYVSSIGDTPDGYEQAWAAGSGLPVRVDVTQHGGGETWTAFVAGVPSMLIEMSGWDATPAMVDAQVAGFSALLDIVVPR